MTFPVSLAVRPAPDGASVAALTYGPVVLAGLTGPAPARPGGLPVLDVSSVRRAPGGPLAFTATATSAGSGARQVQLIPVARVAHQPYTVYWRTA